ISANICYKWSSMSVLVWNISFMYLIVACSEVLLEFSMVCEELCTDHLHKIMITVGQYIGCAIWMQSMSVRIAIWNISYRSLDI
ncbi:hypothetical protein L9F63_004563, partial [Diploptera punctata]